MKVLLAFAVWFHLCWLDSSEGIVTESVYLKDASEDWNATSVSESEDLRYNATSTTVLEYSTIQELTPRPSDRKPKSDKILNTGIMILPIGPILEGTYMDLKSRTFGCYSNSNKPVSWMILNQKEKEFVSVKVSARFPRSCSLLFNRAKLTLLTEAEFVLRCISLTENKDLRIIVRFSRITSRVLQAERCNQVGHIGRRKKNPCVIIYDLEPAVKFIRDISREWSQRSVPSSSVACNITRDCVINFDSESLCLKYGKYCVCPDTGSKLICPATDYARSKESSVFKAAMVTVACFTAVVISVFVLFFVNRTRICRALISPPVPLDDDSPRGNDVFTVSDRLARQRLADKPPTYQEVVCSDRLNRGTPPPAYSEEQEENGNRSSGPSTSRRSCGNSRFEHRRNAFRLPRETADQLRGGRRNRDQQSSNYRPVTVTVHEVQGVTPTAPPSSFINEGFVSDA